MVTCIFGNVKCIGTEDDLAIDVLVLMSALNDTKTNKPETYSNIANGVKQLVHTDDDAKETLSTFLTNLHDLF